jgi:ribosomal protein S18 acetylase RimI-like enzyme
MTPLSPFHAGRLNATTNHSANIRPASAQDLPFVVSIHQKAFTHFFLTRMGTAFLHRYYQFVLNYQTGIILVSEKQGRLDGFVCGFINPAAFYREMWRGKWNFLWPVLSAMLRQPSLATGILYGVHRIQESALKAPPRSCELSSIAVTPEASGSRLGKALVDAFLSQAWSMNAEYIYLTTDADSNDFANAFYQGAGFRRTRRFLQRKGRWMNEYVIHRRADESAT